MNRITNGNTTIGPTRRVPCADTFNRRRTIDIAPDVSTGQVVLAAPPGETAMLSPHEARTLAQRLVLMADTLDADHGQQNVTAILGRRPTG